MTSAYDFKFETIHGRPYPLRELSGLPLVVVNTASQCGFTPQYAALQSVWQAYKNRGLVMIGVPSNDFGGQEPGTHEEIESFCKLNYGVDFPLMGKVHVKGREAHPFFKWAGGEAGLFGRPRWNFFKYLVGRDGGLVDWFSSKTSPASEKFKAAVEKML